MDVLPIGLKDALLLTPKVFGDQRGFFMETYQQERYKDAGIEMRFVQDNISKSSYGTLRGLHFQAPPYDQGKLVFVLEGTVLDVIVDIRKKSLTFGFSSEAAPNTTPDDFKCLKMISSAARSISD